MSHDELTPAGREAKKEYMRKWRESHKEQIREYHREWRKRNPDKVLAAKNRFFNKVGEQNEQQRKREPGRA